jgi:hypothetical protein
MTLMGRLVSPGEENEEVSINCILFPDHCKAMTFGVRFNTSDIPARNICFIMQILIFHGTRNREDFALIFFLCYETVCVRGVFELFPKRSPPLRSFLMLLSLVTIKSYVVRKCWSAFITAYIGCSERRLIGH